MIAVPQALRMEIAVPPLDLKFSAKSFDVSGFADIFLIAG
jgi:hypothetical protein